MGLINGFISVQKSKKKLQEVEQRFISLGRKFDRNMGTPWGLRIEFDELADCVHTFLRLASETEESRRTLYVFTGKEMCLGELSIAFNALLIVYGDEVRRRGG